MDTASEQNKQKLIEFLRFGCPVNTVMTRFLGAQLVLLQLLVGATIYAEENVNEVLVY